MCIIFTVLFCLTSTPDTILVKMMLHLSCIMLKEPQNPNSSQP